jgi:hypothetical protein
MQTNFLWNNWFPLQLSRNVTTIVYNFCLTCLWTWPLWWNRGRMNITFCLSEYYISRSHKLQYLHTITVSLNHYMYITILFWVLFFQFLFVSQANKQAYGKQRNYFCVFKIHVQCLFFPKVCKYSSECNGKLPYKSFLYFDSQNVTWICNLHMMCISYNMAFDWTA